MRRGCLFGCGGFIVLGLAACLLLYFVGLPRVQDRVADDFQEGVSTVVADGLDAAIAEGSTSFVLTEAQLNSQLSDDVEDSDVVANITPDGISIDLQVQNSSDREIGYSAVPTVVDGKLELTNVESEGWMERFLPKDKLADAVEDGVNGVLAERGLVLTDIALGEGEMILTAAPAS
jgi:hypothetical protein